MIIRDALILLIIFFLGELRLQSDLISLLLTVLCTAVCKCSVTQRV